MVHLVASVIYIGRAFYKVGLHTKKALSVNFEQVRGTTRLFPLLDLKSLLGLYD